MTVVTEHSVVVMGHNVVVTVTEHNVIVVVTEHNVVVSEHNVVVMEHSVVVMLGVALGTKLLPIQVTQVRKNKGS